MNKALQIKNLFASIEGKPILNGVSFVVEPGSVHAIMGPNGSGKSTLANVLMGNSAYTTGTSITKSYIRIGKKNIIEMPAEDRARQGLFLAFQSPIAIPGVTVVNLLRSAYQEIHGVKKFTGGNALHNPGLTRAQGMDLAGFTKAVKQYAKFLRMDESFMQRGIGDGFSGGEKKKMEMIQALVLAPKFAIFDEIDTGLDVDALKTVAAGITLLKKQGTGVVIITHYQRILKYLQPDVVHVFVNGRIADTGTARLAKKIEEKGYAAYEHGKTH